jgi:FkbM family methyltransferase
LTVHPTHEEVTRLVRDFFGSETGFFVEVGANHPTEHSQSWHLEQIGWAGVLIEPQPHLAAFLVSARKAKVFAVACTSPEQAGPPVLLYVDGPRSGLEPKRMANTAVVTGTILVPTRTLDSILEEAEAPVPIDLLSVDVEGHEPEVLQGFDFARWQPRLILVEDHVSSLRTHRELKAAGYRLIRRLEFNGWYVPADSPIYPTLRERCEFARKYYLALPFRKLRNALRRFGRMLRRSAVDR